MARNQSDIPDSRDLISTGEAAALCSVTPDTVLKWIRSGKIKAHRTPGGHHRISRQTLQSVLAMSGAPGRPDVHSDAFQYCWEFNSKAGKMPSGCRDCIVYRSGTRRCYEMQSLPTQAGYVGLFCRGSCDDCEYFHTVHGERPNVLVVSDRPTFRRRLEKDMDASKFSLKVTDCEYRCSMVIENFRPDYIVIDCAFGTERSREFATMLYEDPRIPFVRVVLVGNSSDLPGECDRSVFAVVGRRFDATTLSNLIVNSTVQRVRRRQAR